MSILVEDIVKKENKKLMKKDKRQDEDIKVDKERKKNFYQFPELLQNVYINQKQKYLFETKYKPKKNTSQTIYERNKLYKDEKNKFGNIIKAKTSQFQNIIIFFIFFNLYPLLFFLSSFIKLKFFHYLRICTNANSLLRDISDQINKIINNIKSKKSDFIKFIISKRKEYIILKFWNNYNIISLIIIIYKEKYILVIFLIIIISKIFVLINYNFQKKKIIGRKEEKKGKKSFILEEIHKNEYNYDAMENINNKIKIRIGADPEESGKLKTFFTKNVKKCYKSSNKINIRNILWKKIILLYLFINSIKFNFSLEKNKRNFISNSSYITLKINKKGNGIYIYGDSNHGIPCSYTIAPLPDEIFINDVKKNSVQKIYDLSEMKNNIKLVWKNNIDSTSCMFLNCNDINEIDLSNFDSSQVTNTHAMFFGCTSLTSVNLSNFTSPQATEISRMFYRCSSLTSVDLSDFNPLNPNKIYGIFDGCTLLEYANIENLILRDNLDYSSIFNGISNNFILCSKYEKWKTIINGNPFLNCISSFNKTITNYNNEFKCYKKSSNAQNYVNICEKCGKNFYQKYNFTGDINIINCFKESDGFYLDKVDLYLKQCYPSCKTCEKGGNIINHNCTECNNNYLYELNKESYINCYKSCEFYFYYNENNNKSYCTPDLSCPKDINKFLVQKNRQCIDNCTKDNDYKYEFRYACYKECPLNISEKSKIKNFYCEAKCPKEYPFKIIETQDCVNYCSIYEWQFGLCIISKEFEEDKEVEEKVIENVKEELPKNFNTSYIDKGENVIINQKDFTITITSTENQKKEKTLNKSTIDLGECEFKLKEENKIPKNKPLYILKIDIKLEGFQIPKIEYEVYYPLFGDSLVKLDLTVCKNSKIDLLIPVKLIDNPDIINSSSKYYNDICYTNTSSNNIDISLSDRKKEFVNKNLTVCEEDCVFISYDYTFGKANCSCKVKTNININIIGITIDKERLYNSFTDIKNIMNINVLKCYNLIFKLDSFKKNYANFFFAFVILFLIICCIIFCCKDYNYLIQIINMIINYSLNRELVIKFTKKKEEEEKNKNDAFIKNNSFLINVNNKKNIVKSKRKMNSKKIL